MSSILEEAEEIRYRLLELVHEDAEGFEPLSRAYAIPRDDPSRASEIERATEEACMAPLAMVGECCRAVVLLERMGNVCSRLLISDVACGAVLTRAALETASVNVYVNTATLSDRTIAERIETTCSELVDEYAPRAQSLADRMTDLVRSGRQG